MFSGIETMRMAQDMATHASQRHEVIAKNVAQADTPGYRAQDVASFAETYEAPGLALRRTRAAHITANESGNPAVHDDPGRQSPNGNTVSLEKEMMKAGEVRSEHQLALAVYRTSLNILRTSLGRG